MRPARQRGVSLIEMMIGITIAALLMMIGLPSMVTWLNNSQIRTAGETLLAGLTLARVEAVKRNTTVRFQLVSDLTSGCALTTSGTSWVVSLEDPSGSCDDAPSESTSPKIIQAKSGSEGTTHVAVAASGAATVHFNGLGRVTSPSGAANMTQILISNPGGGVCQHLDTTNGTMRCLRIDISTGGEVKMCDPAVTDATDPRKC
jgi:type IV fimbrial biogenesis protein FimT